MNIKSIYNRLKHNNGRIAFAGMLCTVGVLAVSLSSCSEKLLDENSDSKYGIDEGDPVEFAVYLPGEETSTRAGSEPTYKRDDALYNTYHALRNTSYKAYTSTYEAFYIQMYEKDAGVLNGGNWARFVHDGSNDNPSVDGTLKSSKNSTYPTLLYWPDSQKKYGFFAVAGNADDKYAASGKDQTELDKFFRQDRVEGYGYEALLDKNDAPIDNINALNYHTSKEWYKYNQTSYGYTNPGSATVLGTASANNWKKIPLFLQHTRSWITVILKAGGVSVTREDLAYVPNNPNLSSTIYNHGISSPTTPMEIDPYSTGWEIEYDPDRLHPSTAAADKKFTTTRYDAIVEPYNYFENSDATIFTVKLSDMNFSFHACNDNGFNATNKEASSDDVKNAYNLQAGKHLVITAILDKTRLVAITAYVEDWTEEVTMSICDDFGMTGDPIYIETKAQMIEFLEGPENKAGTVAIVKGDINLTSWNGSTYTLNAILNLAGGTLTTDNQFLSSISKTGSLVNGKFIAKQGSSTPRSFLAGTNYGNIEGIELINDNEHPAVASVAGLVETNYRDIINCKSNVPITVPAASGVYYAGGIAGQSVKADISGFNYTPRIIGCTMSAKIKGSDNVTAAGGIVGYVKGGSGADEKAQVTNNTFDYGITISQTKTKYLNIIGAISAGTVTASSNSWPTTDLNADAGTNANTDTYDGVADCQDDMASSMNTTYNIAGKRYLLVENIDLDGKTWNNTGTELKYNLFGNDKTITLTNSSTDENATAKRMFDTVTGTIRDLIINVKKPIIELGTETTKNAEITAPLAKTLDGGTLNNIRVKTTNGAYIKAPQVAGIVGEAKNNAVISNCQFKNDNPHADNTEPTPSLVVHLFSSADDAITYNGGIVAIVDNATITQCVCHPSYPFKHEKDNGDNYFPSRMHNGGIVGGTKFFSADQKATITDCASNYTIKDSDSANFYMGTASGCGAIIGGASTLNEGVYRNGLKDCQGNWWKASCNAVGSESIEQTAFYGMTEVDFIGPRNAVPPTFDTDW